MATRSSSSGSREMTATGFVLILFSVGAGFSSTTGGFSLLLSFAGVLAGAVLIFVGAVRKVATDDDDDDDRTASTTGRPGALEGAGVRVRALVLCLRRNLALVGLLLASSAATATAAAAAEWETNPVLCFCAFALLLLGLSLINVGVGLLLVGDDEQEH